MRIFFAFILMCGMGVCGELTSEQERDIARRELEVINLLRQYAKAQHEFHEINLKRGFAQSVPVLVAMKLIPDISDFVASTGGKKKIHGYVFLEDQRYRNDLHEFGIHALPDIEGIDGRHCFWIGKDNDVYEIRMDNIDFFTERKEPFDPKKEWHKVTEPWLAKDKPMQKED